MPLPSAAIGLGENTHNHSCLDRNVQATFVQTKTKTTVKDKTDTHGMQDQLECDSAQMVVNAHEFAQKENIATGPV